jgi:hypothetical protein
VARRINRSIWFAAALLLVASDGALAEPEQVNTIREAIARIRASW